MDSEGRRRALAERLSRAEGPVSAAALAKELSVSRPFSGPAGWRSPPPPGAMSCPVPPRG